MKYLKNVNILIFIAILLIFNYQPAYAYIDPGTGSMLFSIILGVTTTLFFLFNSIFIKLKSMIFTEKSLNKNNIPYVIYSEGRQYFCVFKPILDEFEKRKIEIVYYTSSKDDPVFNENYTYVKREYIGKGNKAYFKLAFLKADICVMTTPQLDVLQLKRSKNVKHYSHIFHSIGWSGGYRLFSLDYYDSVLLDADFQIPIIRELEKKRNLPEKELVVVGSTYMDYYASRKADIPEKNTEKTVLIAPTWGKNNLINKCDKTFFDKLANSNYNVVIRPHPQSMIVEKDLIHSLMERYKNNKNISWNFDSDNLKVLSEADILISDYSCIMFDYAFLFTRPFIYINTNINYEILDVCDLDEIPWRYKVVDIIGREYKNYDNNQFDITNLIETVVNDENIKNEIIKAKDYAWTNQGNAAQKAVDFLISKQLEVTTKC